MAMLKVEPLTSLESEAVLNAAFDILENTGASVHSNKAISLLRNNGCRSDGKLVRINRGLVKRCFETAPDRVDIYSRDGAPAMELCGENVYYGPGVTCPYVFDPYTGERKTATKQFVIDAATVADALPNVDFLMSLCMIADVTPLFADLQEVHALLTTSPKPILTWAFNTENLQGIIEMFHAAVGGAEQFQEQPCGIVYSEPTSPLVHSAEALDKLILLAERKIPSVYAPGMTLGGTAPVTMAGALSLGLADSFVGLVVSQLARPGAPIILGANGGALDMRTLQSSYSSLEMSLMESAANQIYRRFGIPTFGLAGATDGKRLDMQEGADAAIQCLLSTLSCSNLIHDFGMMDIGMTGSIDLMVYCDELAAMSKFLKRGVEVNTETLAADVIQKVGPGGAFIAEEHTARNFRQAMFKPLYVPRVTYEMWADRGEKTTKELVHEKTLKILKEHKPMVIRQDRKELLDDILGRYTSNK